MKVTAIIEKSDNGWFVGQIEEFPAAISQGTSIEDLKINLLDALHLLLQTQKEETEKMYIGKEYSTEELILT
ncbi:MAG: type II toxin-antitoxin system HicB family antitoxin [Cytophagales bacterium]